jgi:hypothetical protein
MGLRPPSAGSSGTYKSAWASATAYSANDIVTTPAGALVSRITAGTSGAAYDTTEAAAWKPVAASQIADVRTFGAKCDARRVTDAACTINQATITSATAAFTQADVGKRVYVLQTGVLKVVSTIASVQSATQATAANTSAATFTGGVMHIGTDDSAAIQAAINSGAPVVFIPDSCVQHSTVLLRNGLVLMGAGTNSDPGTSYSSGTGPQALRANGYKAPTTLVAFGGSGSMIALDTLGGESDFAVRRIGIELRKSSDANSSRTAGCRGVFVRPGCQRFWIEVEGSDGSNGIVIESSVFGYIDSHWRDARNHNLVLLGSVSQITTGPQSLFQVVDAYGAEGAAGTTNPANVAVLKNGTLIPRNIQFNHRLWDETGLGFNDHSCLYIDSCKDVTLQDFIMYPPSGYGIYLGAEVQDVTIRRGTLEPYIVGSPRIPVNTIFIASGAQRVILEDVRTNPGGGGDISDAGTATVYRNVNGQTSVKTKASAPIAGDFAGLPAGVMRGPILNTADLKLYFLMPDGTVKSLAALT